MKCKNCEREFDQSLGDCPYCGAVPEVDVKQMSSQERDNFSGITIDPERNEENHEQQQAGPKIYFKQVSSSGLISTLIFLIVIGLFIFVAMPLLALIALGIAVIWFFSRVFS